MDLFLSFLKSVDYPSFLGGLALAGIILFATGFLRKAGEDCYAWTKKKVYPSADVQHPPQVSIHVKNETGNNELTDTSFVRLEPVPIDRVSPVTFEEIQETIRAAPPMQRDLVAERYVGLNVEWDTYFKDGSQKVGEDIITIRLTTDARSKLTTVVCKVQANDYRHLGILPEGTKIRVSGQLTKVDMWDMELKDVRLHIFHNQR